MQLLRRIDAGGGFFVGIRVALPDVGGGSWLLMEGVAGWKRALMGVFDGVCHEILGVLCAVCCVLCAVC